MAVLHLSPSGDVFERVSALSEIGRTVVSIRLVCALLVMVWLALNPGEVVPALGLAVAGGALLLLLLRWTEFGVLISTHPVILFLDMAGCFALLGVGGALSPALLLLGTGCLLYGLCLGRRGGWWFSPILVGGWVLVYAAGSSVQRVEASSQAFTAFVLVPALLVGAVAAGVGVREATLRAADAAQGLRAQTRLAGVAEERARLAREMHDSLVKSLHGIAMMADALPRWVEADPEKAKQQAATIAELIKKTSRDSRELVLAMRRAPANATVSQIVASTVERWRATRGGSATVDVDGDPALPTESAYELAAILSEALENVARHTPPGTSVVVRLAEEHSWVRLEVSDDGGGVPGADDLTRRGHVGLVGMRERAARVGGQVRIENRPGKGVAVTVQLPALNDDAEPEDLLLGTDEAR